MIKLKELLKNGKNIYFNNEVRHGQLFSESDVYMHVSNIHRNYEDFEDGDLGERLEMYDKYIVKVVDINKIDTEEFQLDDDLVDEYIDKYKKTNTYPLSVITSDYNIIDGTHRLNALKTIGITKVLVFVGVD